MLKILVAHGIFKQIVDAIGEMYAKTKAKSGFTSWSNDLFE